MNYEKDLEIDVDALDIEWMGHSQLYMKYAELTAKAEQAKNNLKEQLEITKAKLDSEIREKAAEEKIKITENIVAAKIIRDENYQKAIKGYNQAIYDHNILKSAVMAFEHRKKALENLVHLWAGGYFSSPKEPKEEVVKNKILDTAQERQRAGLKRGKK